MKTLLIQYVICWHISCCLGLELSDGGIPERVYPAAEQVRPHPQPLFNRSVAFEKLTCTLD